MQELVDTEKKYVSDLNYLCEVCCGHANGLTDRQTYGWVGGLVGGWMRHGWMDEAWVDRWMD